MIKQLTDLIKTNGTILTLFLLPNKLLKRVLNKLSTFFWKLFLNKCGKNVVIEYGVFFSHPKNIIIKDNVYIGSGTVFGSENNQGKVTLSNNVHIGRDCTFDHTGNITIKENTLFSANVKILSHSHGYNPRSKPIAKDLLIERNCWFGINTIITENVNTIEMYTISASGSIITKDILDNYIIIGGIPAKKIRSYS